MRRSICMLTNAYPDFPDSSRVVFIRSLAALLSRSGCETTVVAPRVFSGGKRREREGVVEVRRFTSFLADKLLVEYDSAPMFRLMGYMTAGTLAAIKCVRDRKCDLIHAHWAVPAGLMALAAGWICRKPVIVTVHGSDILVVPEKSRLIRGLVKYTLTRADAITSVADHLTDRIVEMGAPREKIITFPMSVPNESFVPEGETPEGWLGKKVIFSNRSLYPLYDVETLVRAVPAVVEEEPRAKFVIAGAGPESERLKNLASELGVAEHVEFIGAIPHERMPDYLRGSAAYVSTALSDGASVSLLEAMACGAFPVVADIAANREWIDDGKNGLLFSAGVPDDTIDFREYTVDTYGGSQDHSGSVVIEEGGAALRLTGNRWKTIDFPYTVTPQTVLEFDFISTMEGDIHGIGFDSNRSISSGLTFRVYGSQDWGRDEFAVYNASSGVYHFVIPVGQFYTGKATALVFVNDHDVLSPNAESIFSNVRVHESERGSPTVAAPMAMDDYIVLNEDSATVAFDALANDVGGGAALSITTVGAGSAGGTVSVVADGRIHYRPATDYNGTETFTYTAANAGGSSTATVTVTVRPTNDPPTAGDNRYSVTSGRTYRLNVLNNDSTGVDIGEALTIASVGKGSADGKIVTDGSRINYTPPAGFTGTETFTYTINDGTAGSNATAKVTVRVESPELDSLDFRDYQVGAYGGRQDVVGAALVEEAGRTLRLLGNTWKKIDLPYTITPDTMLEFDFSSISQGDIHGIGLDSNNTIRSSRTFRLYGTQTWGIDEFATYTSKSGTKHYVIRIGKYYTGQVANLFFVNDHDVRNPTAESLFRNIRLYELPKNAAPSTGSAPDSARAVSSPPRWFFGTLDPATGDCLIGGEQNTSPISVLFQTAKLNSMPFGAASRTLTQTVYPSASAGSRFTGALSNLQDLFGFHSLDRGTLTALDQIFAALGDDE